LPCYASPLYLSGTGTLINLNNAVSAVNGIDISTGSFSGSAIKLPGGFSVDGSGVIHTSGAVGAWNSTANAVMQHGSFTSGDGSHLWWKGNVTGTCDGTVTDWNGPDCSYNELIVNTNGVLAGTRGLNAFKVIDYVGGSATTSGGWTAIMASIDQWAQTGGPPLGSGPHNFIAIAGFAQATQNEYGTDATHFYGSVFGQDLNVRIGANATWFYQLIGQEIDLAVANANVGEKIGIQIAVTTADTFRAINNNSGIVIGGASAGVATTGGLNCGLCFGTFSGWNAMASTATLVGTMGNQQAVGVGAMGTVINGVDISQYAFTGSAFKSPGFSVDGSGNVIGRLVATSGFTVATLPAAGTAGRRAFVTDQNAACPAVGGALTGGGAVKCPVFDNGTAWVSG
jgi:hypothetical protein